jgi:hypothetical protein
MGAVVDRASLLDLLRRCVDADGWLAPLLADPDSAAVLLATVDVFARGGRAVDYNGRLGLISDAPGGSAGTASITVARAASGTSGTIPRGYAFLDDRRVALVVQTDVPVAAGDLTVVVPLETLRRCEAVGTEDDASIAISAGNTVVLDALGTTALIAPPGDPAAVATTFQTVAAAGPILAGSTDYLSLHGSERGQARQPGEDTESYRARVRNIPDAVSPLAISQGVQGAASRAGLPPFLVSEPFDDGATPATKADALLGSFSGIFGDSGDFMDDPLGPGEVLDRRTARAYFRLDPTGPLPAPDGLGFFCDADFCDDPVYGFLDVGQHPAVLASLMSVWEEANRKRAAGVQFDLYGAPPAEVVGVGSTTAGVDTLAWTVLPPAGATWVLVDAHAGHDFALPPQPAAGVVPGSSHFVRFDFSDGTSFDAPRWALQHEQRLAPSLLLPLGFPWKPIVGVRGFAASDGVHPINLVGAFRFLELLP